MINAPVALEKVGISLDGREVGSGGTCTIEHERGNPRAFGIDGRGSDGRVYVASR